ncbi:MAG TPA: DUF72 domain-containing protein [Solirubrobacterales bacterium]|nr:DUF72 domain-containing protein [Solirubrobacterales bacterium]
MAGRIVVGTSSWADEGFVKHWYPKGLAARDRLGWYAERFEAVELNSSFYAIPSRDNVERWAEITPGGFSFDVKLHRLLSRHATKPDALPPDMRGDVELNQRGNVIATPEAQRELTQRIVSAVEPLADAGKLGAFLLQLTPGFDPRKYEISELDPIVEALGERTLAVEFRHIGWMEGEQEKRTLAELAERGAAYVCVDAPRERHVPIMPSVDAVTTKRLAYLRCHGRDADRYMRGRSVAERFDYDYSTSELGEIGERAQELAEEVDQVHVMFNNNARDLAPKAAYRMRKDVLGQL